MRSIPFTCPTIGNAEKKEILHTLASGWLTSGIKAQQLELMLSEYLGVRYVIAVNSCTSALYLAVLSCGVTAGDEVITTPFTFCATTNAIIHAGARPVFADIDAETFNIDAACIERKITKRTKAILVVDYAGLPCDMEPILRVARTHRLKVIEDAAHAIGASYRGKKIGAVSDVTCFSFHAAKNMTTGEGGAVVTNNAQIDKFVKNHFFYGIDRPAWQRHKKSAWRYKVMHAGFKYNLSDILASLGIHQLKKLDSFIALRKQFAEEYTSAFSRCPSLRLQRIPPDRKSAYHLYPLALAPDRLQISRDRFIEELKKEGVVASVHFIPIYEHPAYRDCCARATIRSLPVTQEISRNIFSLPLYPRLGLRNVRYVIKAVKKVLRRFEK